MLDGTTGGFMSKKLQRAGPDFFEALPFWAVLNPAERKVVQDSTNGISDALLIMRDARTKLAMHLTELEDVLGKKRWFRRYVSENLRMGVRTAYRWMECYRKLSGRVPEFAIRQALARNIDLVGFQPSKPFGVYTEAIMTLPAPKTESAVPKWLDQLETLKTDPRAKKGHRRAVNSEERMVVAYRAVAGQARQVGNGRAKWVLRLLAVLMAEFDLPAQRIAPEDVPDGFKPVLGRPKRRG